MHMCSMYATMAFSSVHLFRVTTANHTAGSVDFCRALCLSLAHFQVRILYAFAVMAHRCLNSSNTEVRFEGYVRVLAREFQSLFQTEKKQKNARKLLAPPADTNSRGHGAITHVREGSEAARHVAGKKSTRARAGGDERTVVRRFNLCRKQQSAQQHTTCR